MWSKLNQKLVNIFKVEKEQTAEQVIGQAILEIERAIRSTEYAFNSAQKNEQRIAQQLTEWQQQSADLYQKAVEATKSGKDAIAKSFLSSKQHADTQSEQYNQLHQKALFASKEMEKQLGSLQFRLEEMRSKKVLLAAQLKGAQQQKGLNELMADLGDAGILDSMEMQLEQLEIENQLSSGLSEIDIVLGKLESDDSVGNLRSEIEAKELEKQKEEELKRLKKANILLSQSDDKLKEIRQKELKNQKQKQKNLLDDLMSQKDEPVNQDDFAHFFSQTATSTADTQSEENEKKRLLDEWMAEQKEQKPTDWTKEILDEFKKTDKPSDSQKQIDDFFKD